MTFYEWLRECLNREAIRTEPDSREAVRKVTQAMAGQNRPPPAVPEPEEKNAGNFPKT
ncbi:MAG: hypothetical protein ACI4PC_00345 [Oscillospiraceae bacterium]